VANLLGLIQIIQKEKNEQKIEKYFELLKEVAVQLDNITHEIRDRLHE
jgi:hypothetical protein